MVFDLYSLVYQAYVSRIALGIFLLELLFLFGVQSLVQFAKMSREVGIFYYRLVIEILHLTSRVIISFEPEYFLFTVIQSSRKKTTEVLARKMNLAKC